MKRLIAAASILVLFVLSACGAPVEVPEATPEVNPYPADMVTFNDLDSLLAYCETAAAGEDIADLASLREISVPTGLPSGYKLYKITASASDIAFWYLPEECLADISETQVAEAEHKNYIFIDSRGSYDFDAILTQLGGNRSSLINDKYFVTNLSAVETVIWEQDGNVFFLYLPLDTQISHDDLDDYCKIETVAIDGN